MKIKKSSQSGVALLMSLGMLALLSVLGAAFAINMRLLERTTRDFIYEVQARYLAEGGIEYAIAQLKDNARSTFVYNGIIRPSETDKDKITIPLGTLPSGNAIAITAIDTARQVNINNANIYLLDCLPGIGDSRRQAIIDARSAAPFITKKSVCLASGVGSATYDDIKNLISTNTYIDPNVQNDAGASQSRSAVNLNTVDRDLLRDIIAKVDSSSASVIANNIVSARLASPINSWTQFNNITGMTDSVKEAFNPNRKKSSSYYSTFPTEFCFHSGGNYEITATGTVTRGLSTIPVASKTISATANIFNLWNQTMQEQFQGEIDKDWDGILDVGEDTNGDGILNEPVYTRVTWLDSCPLNLNVSYPNTGYDATAAETINDSLKMGFWEDFNFWDASGNLIQDRWDYSKAQWYGQQGRFFVKQDGALSKTVRAVWDTPTVDLEFYRPGGGLSYPILCLGRTDANSAGGASSVPIYIRNRWKWSEFSLRLYLRSYNGQYISGAGTIIDRATTYPITWRYLAASEGGGVQLARKYDVGAHIFLKRNSERPNSMTQRDVFINHADPWKWDRAKNDADLINQNTCGSWNSRTREGQWYVSDSLMGRFCILDSVNLGHEGVKDRISGNVNRLNDDNNKNPLTYPIGVHPYKDNDDPDKESVSDTGPNSDLENNIDAGWENIYYYPLAFPSYSYLCIGTFPTTGGVEDEAQKLEKYYEAGQYNILFTKPSGDRVEVNARLSNYNSGNNDLETEFVSKSRTAAYGGAPIPDGHIAFYAAEYLFIARDIRIIDKTGYYSFNIPDRGGISEWGSIWGTETMPGTASVSSEKVAFQVSLDGANWYPNVNQFSEIDSQLQPESGSIFCTLQGAGASTTSNTISYRANFTTSDPAISKTPVLEDVWITYLPKTKISFWKE